MSVEAALALYCEVSSSRSPYSLPTMALSIHVMTASLLFQYTLRVRGHPTEKRW